MLTLLCSLCLVVSPVVLAKTVKSLVLSVAEHKRLSAIESDIQGDKSAQAHVALTAFVQRSHSTYAQALGWQMLAMLDYKAHRWSAAKQHFTQALRFSKLPAVNKGKIYSALFQIEYHLKDWQGSIDNWLLLQKYATSTQRKALTANNYLVISDSYRELQQWHTAKKHLQKALKMTAAPPAQWRQRQWSIERHINTTAQNIELLKQLIELYPQQERYWLALALQYKGAAKTARMSASLHTAFINGALKTAANILWLANSLSEQGNPALAVEVIESAQRQALIDENPKAVALLTQLYIKAKMFDDALQLLESSVRQEAGFANHKLLAQLYFKRQRWESAYDSAMQIAPEQIATQVSIQLILGVSSMQLKHTTVAKTHFSRILELAPNHLLARQAMSQLH